MLPLSSPLVTEMKSEPRNTPRHALDVEETGRQRRSRGLALAGEIRGAVGKHGLSGNELQRRRIGGGLGLNEHGLPFRVVVAMPLGAMAVMIIFRMF